jgi:hypothetical protein
VLYDRFDLSDDMNQRITEEVTQLLECSLG